MYKGLLKNQSKWINSRRTSFLVWLFLFGPCQSVMSALPSTSLTGSVEIINGATPGSLELLVHGSVNLDTDLSVERQLDDGSFQLVKFLDLGAMKLTSVCHQALSKCIRVDERGLRPVPWSGMSCASQCYGNCDKNVALHGHFRFVVKTCDGKNRFEGPVFEMP